MRRNIYKIVIITMIVALFTGHVYASVNDTKSEYSVINNSQELKIASSKTNTIVDPATKNSDLKELKIEGYELYPTFDKNITNYYCIIDNSIKSVEIEATAESEDASVKITGNASLTKDENTINVVVTSKSGNKKTYSIIAKKRKNTELALESLTIDGAKSELTITENKFRYDTEVEVKEIAPLNIVAKANNENATVEILGNDESLLEGDNTITIILKNGQDTTIYQINIKIKLLKETQVVEYVKDDNFIVNLAGDISKRATEFFSDDKNTLMFLCVVMGILVILIIIFIIRIVKRNKINKNKENIKKRAQ